MKVSKPVVPMGLESLWVLFVEQAAHILEAEQERLSAEDYLMDSDDCIQTLREAVPAVPAVQGEPLGYVVPRMAARLGKGELCGISVLDQPEDGHTLPVYLTPQPAEQQPAPAVQGEPAEQYNHKRIGWELERTAMGDGYYGNALRVAKDFPELSDEDRSVLDRYATGAQRHSDHIALQVIAMKVYAAPQPAEQHPDDTAVDRFAAAMKAKLNKKRQEGRGGWQSMTAEQLSALLHEHVRKGDPVDVANLAMMLRQNGQRIEQQPAPDVAGLLDLLRDIGNVCRKPEMPSEQAIAEWADRIDAALQEGPPCEQS